MRPRVALGSIVFLILAGCSDSSGTVATVARAKSPSGRVEALLDENNGGATTSFGYAVSLRLVSSPTATGVRVASAYGAVRDDRAYGMNLVWVDENTLEIQYWKARWAIIERPSIAIDGEAITSRMKADVRDEAAPAGGMLYNVQRRSTAADTKHKVTWWSLEIATPTLAGSLYQAPQHPVPLL